MALTSERIAQLRRLLRNDVRTPWYVATDDKPYDCDGHRAHASDAAVEALNAVPDLLDEAELLRHALREMRDAFVECTGQYPQDLAYDDLARAADLLGEDVPERRMCEDCGERPAEAGEGLCGRDCPGPAEAENDAGDLLVDEHGQSLSGLCGFCERNVDNHDPLHRVSGILAGGRGVECVLRGDIEPHEAMPLCSDGAS